MSCATSRKIVCEITSAAAKAPRWALSSATAPAWRWPRSLPYGTTADVPRGLESTADLVNLLISRQKSSFLSGIVQPSKGCNHLKAVAYGCASVDGN